MSLDVALDTLPAGALAHYAWGHYRIWLSPEAAAQAPDFAMHSIAQVIAGSAQWPDAQSFACFVALLHEFVHYQQDVGTGCGHWDALAREAMVSEVLYEARNQSWFPKQPLPLPAAQSQDLADRYAESSLFNLYRRRKSAALASLRAEVIGSPAYTPGCEADLGIDALLELDAVLAVQRVVHRMRTDEHGRKITAGARHLYAPLDMPDAYRRPYELMLDCFRELFFGTRSEIGHKDVEHLLDTMELVAPVLLDIAFAHPPPSYFTGPRTGDRPHFEPGLRWLRAVRSIESASDCRLGDVYADVERITRSGAGYDYPSLQTIYQDWAAEFETRAPKDPVAVWRLEQCRQRLKHPQAIERRDLPNVISHGLPLLLDSPSWPSARLLVTGRLLSDDGALYGGLRESGALLALAQWFLGGSPGGFACPHADSQWCSAALASCRSGHAAIWNLPQSADCQVRRGLDHWAFQLDAPLPL